MMIGISGGMLTELLLCEDICYLGIGRVLSGIIADLPAIKKNGNRIILQQVSCQQNTCLGQIFLWHCSTQHAELLLQVSFFSIGLCTMLLVAAPSFGHYKYEALMVFCLVMGIFDGCFITMLGPIAFDICGPQGAGQAIGFLLSLCSLPLTIGPPVAGLIYDKVARHAGSNILSLPSSMRPTLGPS